MKDTWATIDDRVAGYLYNEKFWCLACLPLNYTHSKLTHMWRESIKPGTGIVCCSCRKPFEERRTF